jgi:hypothetical protein
MDGAILKRHISMHPQPWKPVDPHVIYSRSLPRPELAVKKTPTFLERMLLRNMNICAVTADDIAQVKAGREHLSVTGTFFATK